MKVSSALSFWSKSICSAFLQDRGELKIVSTLPTTGKREASVNRVPSTVHMTTRNESNIFTFSKENVNCAFLGKTYCHTSVLLLGNCYVVARLLVQVFLVCCYGSGSSFSLSSACFNIHQLKIISQFSSITHDLRNHSSPKAKQHWTRCMLECNI